MPQHVERHGRRCLSVRYPASESRCTRPPSSRPDRFCDRDSLCADGLGRLVHTKNLRGFQGGNRYVFFRLFRQVFGGACRWLKWIFSQSGSRSGAESRHGYCPALRGGRMLPEVDGGFPEQTLMKVPASGSLMWRQRLEGSIPYFFAAGCGKVKLLPLRRLRGQAEIKAAPMQSVGNRGDSIHDIPCKVS